MKNQKGITLIALVITIIVLLILAGVAIAMLSGENGILSRASESSVQNALGTAKDQCALIAYETLTDYYEEVYVSGNSTGAYNTADLDTKVAAAITDATVDVKGVTVTWTKADGAEAVSTGASVELKYNDGSTVTGTLSDGAIKWGDINLADDDA